MSLNFDLKAVRARLGEERYEEVTTSPETRGKPEGERQWHPVTNSLIWLSMGVGLGEISEKNVDEWCFRIALIEKLDGPSFNFMDGRSVHMGRKDIEDHVGLKTNVSDETRKKWVSRIIEGSSYRLVLKDGASAGDAINAIYANENKGNA